MMAQKFTRELQEYVSSLQDDFSSIAADRKEKLAMMADYITQSEYDHGQSKLLFVCTHNSRRSQFAQVWLHTASVFYVVKNILTYSGGTEATAANERVISALERAGFSVNSYSTSDGNHRYEVSPGEGYPPDVLFSKLYSDTRNPREKFAAIMVCSDADQACPIVVGAEERISLPFDDPKAYDGTPEEADQYDKSCHLIAIEMFYAMSLVKEI
jgi:arsenate reductase